MQSWKQLFVVAAVVAPALSGAQASLTRGDQYFDVYSGVSFFTDGGPHFALLRNRKVVMLGFKHERVFNVGPHFAWASTLELPISMIL
ncbi:MAG TPA: hypothetical protein VF483_09040, partial [Gemmatimonadaceae bacterium]